MSERPSVTLSRELIIDGLRELLEELPPSAAPVVIQIVRGAAIALSLDASRRATRDVDGPLTPVRPIEQAAGRVAARRGWPDDWINDSAAQFLPNGFGRRTAEWTTVHADERATIQVATPATLLAMKLHAAQRRGPRDAGDLAVLLRTLEVGTVDEAEELYGDFYAGEGLNAATWSLVETLLTAAPDVVTPEPPDFSPRGRIDP